MSGRVTTIDVVNDAPDNIYVGTALVEYGNRPVVGLIGPLFLMIKLPLL